MWQYYLSPVICRYSRTSIGFSNFDFLPIEKRIGNYKNRFIYQVEHAWQESRLIRSEIWLVRCERCWFLATLPYSKFSIHTFFIKKIVSLFSIQTVMKSLWGLPQRCTQWCPQRPKIKNSFSAEINEFVNN